MKHAISPLVALTLCLAMPARAQETPAPAADQAAGEAVTTTEVEVASPELQTADDAYELRLRGLEERVNQLKENIFRSKARLMLLRETVLHGAITGARAVLVHSNEMGGSFILEQVAYSLDGAPIYSKVDTDGSLSDQDEIEIFNGNIVPGNHNISVYMVYRGYGYGIFSYLKGYKFKIKSSYAFQAEEGKVTNIRIVGYEKGGLTTDLKDRPSVRYDVEVKSDLPRRDDDAHAGSAGTDG